MIESSHHLSILGKFYVLVHHSIMIQLILLLLFMTISLSVIHYQCKKTYQRNLEEIVRNQNEKYLADAIEENNFVSQLKNNQSSTDQILKVEDKKFDHFLSLLDQNLVKKS